MRRPVCLLMLRRFRGTPGALVHPARDCLGDCEQRARSLRCVMMHGLMASTFNSAGAWQRSLHAAYLSVGGIPAGQRLWA